MIRLESISIENFRGIRESRIEGFTDVNILIGRNNCGKTTVLESIMRCLNAYQPIAGELGYRLDDIWNSIRQTSNSTDEKAFYFRQDAGRAISVEVTLSGMISKLSSPVQFRVSSSSFQMAGTTQLTPSHESFIRRITLLDSVLTRNPDCEKKTWASLLSNRRDKPLIEILNDVFGLNAEAIQLLPDNQAMLLFDTFGIPLDSQGDGTRLAIRSLMLLFMLESTLVMMEEPESHQHPGSLAKYAQAVCRVCKRQKIQLMITTHSDECIKAFLKGARMAELEGAVYHLKIEDGRQQSRRFDAESYETLSETGIDVRFADLYA